MTQALARKQLNGVSLCADPAREPCFTVANRDEEMTSFAEFTSPESRRERLHRHMNNEVGALEIAAQCLVDFPGAAWDLQLALARQAADESRHVEGLYRRLRELGGRKGEFPIANFEWCVTNTQDTVVARLAIQNRTFEAGQMDLLGTLRNKWREAGDDVTAELLESILADEVNHVRFANRWIRRIVQEDGRALLKVALTIRFLAEANAAGLGGAAGDDTGADAGGTMVLPTNVEDRRHAGFSDEEIAEVLRQSGMSSFLSASRAPVPDGQ